MANIASFFQNKKALGIFILALAVLISLFLVVGSREERKGIGGGKENELETEEEPKAKGFNLEKDGEKIKIGGLDDLSRFLASQAKKNNLTENFAEKISAGFIGANQGNESIDVNGLFVPDSQELIFDSFEDFSKEFSLEKDFISVKDLRLSPDNSQQAVLVYYTKYKEILVSCFSQMEMEKNLNAFVQTQNIDKIFPIISGYDCLIAGMKNLATPSDFASLQKELVNFYIAEKAVFGSLVNLNQDPLRAITSLNFFQSLEDGIYSLGLEINKELERHGFKIIEE